MNISPSLRLLSLAAVMVAFAIPAAYSQGYSPNQPPGHSRHMPAKHRGKGHHFHGDGGSAPVPEAGTWLAMGSLAAAAVVFGRRHFKKPGIST